MKRSIRLSPVAPLAPVIGDGELVAFNVGPDAVTYFVVAQKPLDYRVEQPGGATFAKTVPHQPQSYRVVGLSGSQTPQCPPMRGTPPDEPQPRMVNVSVMRQPACRAPL